jgi:hypothetical protein
MIWIFSQLGELVAADRHKLCYPNVICVTKW